MRRWTRLTNSLLALLLAVVFAMPAAAESGEESSTQTSGTVTLSGGQCRIDLHPRQAKDLDFGVWKWNGDAYVRDSGSSSHVVEYVVKPASKGCNMSISTNGLEHVVHGKSALIGPEHLGVQMEHSPGGRAQWTSFDASGSVSVPWGPRVNHMQVNIGILNLPKDIPPGTYEGTFTLTVSNAQ